MQELYKAMKVRKEEHLMLWKLQAIWELCSIMLLMSLDFEKYGMMGSDPGVHDASDVCICVYISEVSMQIR